MNTLIFQDVFEPYYAGRPGFRSPDLTKPKRQPAKSKGEQHEQAKDQPDREPDAGTEH